MRRLAAAACGAVLLLVLAACTQTTESPDTTAAVSGADMSEKMTEQAQGGQEATGKEMAQAHENSTVPYVNNDTVELGTYDAFEPAEDITVDAGQAIEGNEEEELQQERIAGGAVGEVVSKNLEPLTGIVDYAEGEYEAKYGVSVE